MTEPDVNVWFLVAGMMFIAMGAWTAGAVGSRRGINVTDVSARCFGAAFITKGAVFVSWGAGVLPLSLFGTGVLLTLILLAAGFIRNRPAARRELNHAGGEARAPLQRS